MMLMILMTPLKGSSEKPPLSGHIQKTIDGTSLWCMTAEQIQYLDDTMPLVAPKIVEAQVLKVQPIPDDADKFHRILPWWGWGLMGVALGVTLGQLMN
jgi:hypothetical protein